MRSWGSQHLSHVHLLQAQAFDECGTRVLGGAGMHCGVESCTGGAISLIIKEVLIAPSL